MISLKLRKKGRRTRLQTAIQVGPFIVKLSDHDVTRALDAYRAVASRVTITDLSGAPNRVRLGSAVRGRQSPRVRMSKPASQAPPAPGRARPAAKPTIIDIRPGP